MGSCLSRCRLCCCRCCDRCERLCRRGQHIRPVTNSTESGVELEIALTSPSREKFSDEPSLEEQLPIHIDEHMSSPTIRISETNGSEDGRFSRGWRLVSGHGLALAAGAAGTDRGAYWEWHVGTDGGASTEQENVMVGVSTKRTPEFYKILEKSDGGKCPCHLRPGVEWYMTASVCLREGTLGHAPAGWSRASLSSYVPRIPLTLMPIVETFRRYPFSDLFTNAAASSLKLATKLMRTVSACPGDTVGVTINLKVENPFVQLFLNGELQEEFRLGRFRGSLYPSIWLPGPDGTAPSVTFIHSGSEFRQLSPGAQFLPLEGLGMGDEVIV